MSLTASQHRHTYLAYTHYSLQILESPCCLLSFPKARLYLEEYTFRTNSQCSYNQLFDRVWSSRFMILILPSDVFFLQLNFHLRILCIILKCFYHIQPVNTILAVSQKTKKDFVLINVLKWPFLNIFPLPNFSHSLSMSPHL